MIIYLKVRAAFILFLMYFFAFGYWVTEIYVQVCFFVR